VGDHLRFTISFPGLLEPKDLEGVVRWRQPPDPGRPEAPPGLGVEFLFRSEAERMEMYDLVRSLSDNEVEDPNQREASDCFRVLLVEDNDFVQDLFAYTVECYHYEHIRHGTPEILRASDGQQALSILEKRSVDLAIIDHFLPLMTGCELIRRIRRNLGMTALPIVVVSVGGEEVKREALEAGANLYLDKPVLNRQLVQTISTLLMRKAS
jgi:CheY-like chemotaxis protein